MATTELERVDLRKRTRQNLSIVLEGEQKPSIEHLKLGIAARMADSLENLEKLLLEPAGRLQNLEKEIANWRVAYYEMEAKYKARGREIASLKSAATRAKKKENLCLSTSPTTTPSGT